MAVRYSPKIVTDGLVLALDAANTRSYPGSGIFWNDISGNSNNSTLISGPTFSSADGGSILLDGTNDYVKGVHNSQLDTTGSMTGACWFKLTDTASDWVRVLGKGDSTNRTFGLWYNTGSNTFLYQRYGSSYSNVSTTSFTVALNTWWNMVGTSSGSSHVLYLNGEAVSSGSTGSTFHSSTDPYQIGYAGYHTYHQGNVANCKIYNRALSAAEVLQNFDAMRGRFGL